jgi:hypothetical protein
MSIGNRTTPHHLQAGKRAFVNATFSSSLANITAESRFFKNNDVKKGISDRKRTG